MSLAVEGFAGVHAQAPVRVVRPPQLVERVVCVGGLSGCGKTMITAIVGSLDRVELQRFNYTIEYLCALRLLGRLDADASTTMIRMLADLDLYNLMMTRDINMRFSDISSIFRNPGTWRYLRRLFQPGDAASVERIWRERPILHLFLHNVLVNSPPLFEALGDAVRVVEVVRHPLHMLKAWHYYVDRYGTDVRDFTIWFDYQGRSVPFFAQGWEEQFLRSNTMEKSIYAIAHLVRWGQRTLAQLPEVRQRQVMIIPFERFVFDPWSFLHQLETFLDTHVTALTRREMKRQRVPRARLADGRKLSIYRQYGWRPAEKCLTDGQQLQRLREFAAGEASAEALRVLDALCEEYDATYHTAWDEC